VTLKPLRYDVWAALQKWPTIDRTDRTPKTGDILHPATVFEGTVAACIREFMTKPISQRPLYEMSTEPQEAFTSAFVSATDMLEIASRDDFPKE
jgi:hypothetical protein